VRFVWVTLGAAAVRLRSFGTNGVPQDDERGDSTHTFISLGMTVGYGVSQGLGMLLGLRWRLEGMATLGLTDSARCTFGFSGSMKYSISAP
jgi:hypothetical protein